MTKQREKASREKQILAVSRRHFEQFGYKKTTIDGIVQEVGIAKGTFFLHFQSKEALLIGVFQQLRQEVLTRFETCMSASSPSPSQQLETLLRFALEQLRAYPLFLRLHQIDPEFRLFRQILDLPDTQQELDQALNQLRAILQAGIDCGEFRQDLDLNHLPYILGSLKFLMFYPELITANGQISTQSYIDTLIALIMKGLQA